MDFSLHCLLTVGELSVITGIVSHFSFNREEGNKSGFMKDNARRRKLGVRAGKIQRLG